MASTITKIKNNTKIDIHEQPIITEIKKITREKFTCYIGLVIIWTVTAIVLDYIFIVKLL